MDSLISAQNQTSAEIAERQRSNMRGKPKPGTKVTADDKRVMTIESSQGAVIWCTWEEDGQVRRGVFAKEGLEVVQKAGN